MLNKEFFTLTNVLGRTTCAPVLLPLTEVVRQAKVDKFDDRTRGYFV